MTISLPTDMDTGRATVEWTIPQPEKAAYEWFEWSGVSILRLRNPRFDPRRRLTGLALRLLAASNALRGPR